MSFSPIGPFAFGSKLSSAAMNQLDADHVNSLDKSVAGDSIFGRVVLDASGGLIWAVSAGQITARAAGAIETIHDGGITLGGSSADWITFTTPRTRSVAHSAATLVPSGGLGSGWTSSGYFLLGPGTTAG